MRVFSNTAVSVDGKIATREGGHAAFGSPEDRRVMGLLRAHADAVLVGGRTFRAWPLPLVEAGPSRRPRRMVNAVLTRTGVGPRAGRFFEHPRILPVILGGPEADLDGFPAGVAIHRCPVAPTVAWACDVLERAHRVRTLLVEGGGDLVFQFLDAGLLQDLYVTVCPRIVGGAGASTLADGKGFPPETARRLRLMSARRLGSELFLHYRVLA
ncbi:MAG: RibD family protein [Deltaproteobacteria bacterium]|nr:RibD family protein [Deltaproteobacteria bacterium]